MGAFTLSIPFTLSILKVAIVEQEGIVFAIPASAIIELFSLNVAEITTDENKLYLTRNQKQIPLVNVRENLSYNRAQNNFNFEIEPAIDRPMALIIGDERSQYALQISRFWQEQESTTRSIDSPIPLPPGIVSSVLFGNGKVIPLVEPMLLVEECLRQDETLKNSEEQNIVPNSLATSDCFTIKTILIADDSINVRRYLSLILERAGYRVEEAKDGQEAVDKLLGGLVVDGMICDIEMPRLDGYGVLEEIKERDEFTSFPIAMLTSRSNEKHRKIAMNLGASAYFSKPFNEQELLEKMANLLEAV